MDLKVPVPADDDPIWTDARGFVVRKGEGPVKLTNGGRERAQVKLTGDQSSGQLAFQEMDVTPGFGNTAHAHGAEDEAFYVKSGRFKFINGSGTVEAGPGDFIYVPRLVRHGFKNISSDTGTLLIFYTPAGAEQFFLKYGDDPDPDGGAAPEWTPERFAEMSDALAAHNMILLPRSGDWE